jgi:hypothetical protein
MLSARPDRRGESPGPDRVGGSGERRAGRARPADRPSAGRPAQAEIRVVSLASLGGDTGAGGGVRREVSFIRRRHDGPLAGRPSAKGRKPGRSWFSSPASPRPPARRPGACRPGAARHHPTDRRWSGGAGRARHRPRRPSSNSTSGTASRWGGRPSLPPHATGIIRFDGRRRGPPWRSRGRSGPGWRRSLLARTGGCFPRGRARPSSDRTAPGVPLARGRPLPWW